ncbi:hypothetical protein ACU1JV_00850 [Paenibacillus sp. T2-29]|uniref:hypothetical protein n=1 Tax=Paenibacillus TaxID=44249 RepID=UPI0039BC244B
MKTVTLEEKLIAQVKNIVAILQSENPNDVKIMMLEMQKDYLNAYINNMVEALG